MVYQANRSAVGIGSGRSWVVSPNRSFALLILQFIGIGIAIRSVEEVGSPPSVVLPRIGSPGPRYVSSTTSGGFSRRMDGNMPCPTIPPTNPQDCRDGRPCVVDIKESAKATENRVPFDTLKDALARPNTTVRIGPDVELDFNGLESSYFPLKMMRCVTLMSVAAFEPSGGTTPIFANPYDLHRSIRNQQTKVPHR